MSATPPDLHPHDADAEKSVLGSLLLDNEVTPDVAAVLTREAFYLERHRHVYAGISSLYDDGGPVDLVTPTCNLRTRADAQRRATTDEARERVRTIVVIRPED